MRNVKFILKFVLACVIGIVLQLTLHEMGHALFAAITGNEIVDINIGVVSFATINVKNAWSIPVISIGSFVLPIIICAILEFIPCVFVKMLNTIILTITTIQLGINSVAVYFVKNHDTLQTYDLGVLITSGNANNILVGSIALIVTIALLVWCVCKLIKVADSI